MPDYIYLIIGLVVGAALAWGFRGWIARSKEKIQRKVSL